MTGRLIEIELRVADVERSRLFYRDLIGLDVGELERHGDADEPHTHATWGAWEGPSPSLLMLNIYPAGPAEPTSARIGFVVDDLSAVHERLRASGAQIISAPEIRPWGRTASYRDPDGNVVSLTEAPG